MARIRDVEPSDIFTKYTEEPKVSCQTHGVRTVPGGEAEWVSFRAGGVRELPCTKTIGWPGHPGQSLSGLGVWEFKSAPCENSGGLTFALTGVMLNTDIGNAVGKFASS